MAQARDGGAASPRGQERRRERIGACYAWNESRCTFVRCRYENVCSQCGGDHRKVHCREEGNMEWEVSHRGTDNASDIIGQTEYYLKLCIISVLG